MTKALFAMLCGAIFALAPVAHAQDKGKGDEKKAEKAEAKKKEPSEAQKKQQQRMADCNEKASDKKGDDRKKFMSSCLKGEEPGKMSQQDKMKKCNADAKDKKGDDRKKFMSECLKG